MFRTGEFSKIARVSKRLLHYYDTIGLFEPALLDEATGYRYYSAKQIPRLNRILALKELGLTLNQVTKVLEAGISDEEIQGMLVMKKAEMEQTIQENVQRLRAIEARLQLIHETDEAPDVVLKSIPAQPFLSLHNKLANMEAGMVLIDEIFRTVPGSVKNGTLGSFLCVAHTEDFTASEIEVELGYVLHKPVERPIALSNDQVLRVQELPAVATMATAVQSGGPDPVLAALGLVARWIEANGYRIAGPYREICFQVSSVRDLEDALVEIQVPVEIDPRQSRMELRALS